MQQNSHLVGTRDTTKWTDVRNIKWTKINMVTHVIRGQPFYILGEGVVLNLTGCHRFSFSNHQIKTFTFMRTLAFIPSKQLQATNKLLRKMAFWKFLLNYSLSAGSPSFINYLFSIFWQWINLFHCDGNQIVYFRQKKWGLIYLFKKSNKFSFLHMHIHGYHGNSNC